jgi:signal transducing adaptor molecule
VFQLLDACVSNCGKTFHLEVASRDFETEFRKLLSRSQPRVAEKLRQLLKKWAENDFKNDPQLNLIPSLYAKLKQEGIDFTMLSETVKVKEIPFTLKINLDKILLHLEITKFYYICH